MDALQAVQQARELLENVTPLKRDCGRLCGGACCAPDDEGNGGMWLFPHEEELYLDMPEGFSITKEGERHLLECEGFCDRNTRPLACRIFPLLPVLKEGKIKVTLDKRGYFVCPLLPHGLSAFDGEFKERIRAVGELLYAHEEHKALLDSIHQEIAAYQTMAL